MEGSVASSLRWMANAGFEIRDGFIRPKLLRAPSAELTRTLEQAFDYADQGRKGYLTRADLEVASTLLLGYSLLPLDLEALIPEKDLAVVTNSTDGTTAGDVNGGDAAMSTGEEHGDGGVPAVTARGARGQARADAGGATAMSTAMTRNRFVKDMLPYVRAVGLQEEIRQTFAHFDLSCAGFISAGDFCHLVREVAPGISIATAENAFRQIDCDRDDRVSYRDFERMMQQGAS